MVQTPVLWHPPLRHVEPAADLRPRDQRDGRRRGHLDDVMQVAVDALPDPQAALGGGEVHIARVAADREVEQDVEQQHGILERGGEDVARIGREEVPDGVRMRFGVQFVRAGTHAQHVELGVAGVTGHVPDMERAVLKAERESASTPCERRRDRIEQPRVRHGWTRTAHGDPLVVTSLAVPERAERRPPRRSLDTTARLASRDRRMQELWMTVRVLSLALLALIVTGCRIDVGTDVSFGRDGGGEVAVSVRIDGATLRQLDAAGVDPALDVDLTLGSGSGWRPERTIDADGGLVLTYRQGFRDGREATALLRELSEGVAPQDPAVRLDVTVVTNSSGGVRIAGTGALSAPATIGVTIDERPVGPTGAELAALTASAVRGELVVHVAGRIVEHDADRVDGGTLRWALPVGEARPILLVADGSPLWRRVPWWGVVAAVVFAGLAVALVRGRSGRGRSDDDAPGVSPAG